MNVVNEFSEWWTLSHMQETEGTQVRETAKYKINDSYWMNESWVNEEQSTQEWWTLYRKGWGRRGGTISASFLSPFCHQEIIILVEDSNIEKQNMKVPFHFIPTPLLKLIIANILCVCVWHVPWWGSNPPSLHSKRRVLTTGPPGMFLTANILMSFVLYSSSQLCLHTRITWGDFLNPIAQVVPQTNYLRISGVVPGITVFKIHCAADVENYCFRPLHTCKQPTVCVHAYTYHIYVTLGFSS